MSFQAQALYDFDGEPHTAELSITVGEILTVTKTDVGEGWWEGLNSVGKSGLFPEAYVERVVTTSAPPSTPAPVLPANPIDEWGDAAAPTAPQNHRYAQDADDWDDEWDEDPYSEIQGQHPTTTYMNVPGNNNQQLKQFEDNISEGAFGPDNKGTITKKSFNRFSTFVKSGGESYILGTLKVHVEDHHKITIIKQEDGCYWSPIQQPYTVLIASHKKESKLKGLKTFIAYQLTPSYSGIAVARRYKHFDWLHERLTEKFSLIAVPPLPDKQLSGRYEQQFIEHRRAQLQEFVNWVCRHPILATCDVWQHFLNCTDEKLWKVGKRQAEKDPLVGANFCLCIEAPDKNLLQSSVDETIETNTIFINTLDAAVKNLLVTASDQARKHAGMYKKEFGRIGDSFYALGTAIESAEKAIPTELATAIKKLGTAYVDIGKIYEEQPKLDWDPLSVKLYMYKGITNSFPDIFTVHKGAQQKRKECEKTNMPPAQLNEVRNRTDTVSYAIFAELNHFKVEREADMKVTIRRFIEEQVNFYRKVADKLEDTMRFFD